ncbi:MAG TPA: DUF5996 family protein [Casimicrobiaceae bacterium]|nr:DUF5996 family protein [Casimicrobiaceae bacterium]
MSNHRWPELPFDAWKDTYATLHLWTQVVGKIRLARMPWLNHTWQVTLYPSAHGLTTGRMPYAQRAFELELDFVAHRLRVRVSDGADRSIALKPMSVAQFYESVTSTLAALEMPVSIYAKPNEVENPIAFNEDDEHRSYDAEYANRCWRIMCSTAEVFGEFRSAFYGKASPVHFFWGAFDLAVTRFSGRVAPLHPAGVPNLPDRVVRDAYSHEVSSAGFWPGGATTPYALFYSYAYPEPNGFANRRVEPSATRYDTTLKEFVLPYDDMRNSDDPEVGLMAFLRSTYEAAADLSGWDRAALEVPAERLSMLQNRGFVSR